MTQKPQKSQSGAALLPFIVVIPFLILITTYFMDLAVASFKLARKDQLHTHSQFAADAGIDFAVRQVNENPDWLGTASEVELFNDGQIKTTYQVSVSNPGPNAKTLTVTGRTFRPVTSTAPETSVKLLVDMRQVNSANYSVVTGIGGLQMSNNSIILAGNVLVNGKILMQNSSRIGLSFLPVNVEVANQVCPIPADSNYPRLCNAGENDNPITLQNSARIYGTVKANHQLIGAGMSSPGLTASSGVPAQSLPPHDRNAQKAAIVPANDMTGGQASCSSGTLTWNANTKITGNVAISGNCRVTVNGDIWITGTFNISNSARLIVSNSLGATRPNIMVDGPEAKFSNSVQLLNNSSGTGVQIINYWSNAACSPDCSSVSGVDLFNSQSVVTIELNNSASGFSSIFYAKWSKVLLNNSGSIGALVGQTIELKNSGSISFGSSSGVTLSRWVIDGYRRGF